MFSPFEFSITFEQIIYDIFQCIAKIALKKKKENEKKIEICKFKKDFFALLCVFYFRFVSQAEEKEEQVAHRDAHPQIENLLLLSRYIVYLSHLPLAKAKQAIEPKDKNKLHLRAGAHKLSRALGKCGR